MTSISELTAHAWTLLQHAAGNRSDRSGSVESWSESLVAGWGGPQTTTLLTALIAITGVIATILTTSARAQREHRANLYADSLSGVADYLEGPYRIRRKDGSPGHRNVITAGLSDVKSAIDHSRELLRLHVREDVANFFDDYVLAATIEAGPQMREAWTLPAIATDAEVNLYVGYDRDLSKKYRGQTVRLMQADLDRRWWRPWVRRRYNRLVQNQLQKPEWPAAPS